VLADYDYKDSDVAVMINGLGATPLMELYILNNEVEKILSENNIRVYKSYVGNYMTSLEMSGASVTLMKLDDELKTLIDAPCDTPALKG
jgi:dihydroxyacetone kinase-like protein